MCYPIFLKNCAIISNVAHEKLERAQKSDSIPKIENCFRPGEIETSALIYEFIPLSRVSVN